MATEKQVKAAPLVTTEKQVEAAPLVATEKQVEAAPLVAAEVASLVATEKQVEAAPSAVPLVNMEKQATEKQAEVAVTTEKQVEAAPVVTTEKQGPTTEEGVARALMSAINMKMQRKDTSQLEAQSGP